VATAQADVIARALDDLPDRVPAEIRAEAERVLIAHAGTFAPRELRHLGRRILDVIAPEVAEDQQRRKLEDEERHARRTTSLSTRINGDGTTTIRIRIPDATADRLMTYLHAWTNPRRTHTTAHNTDGTDGTDGTGIAGSADSTGADSTAGTGGTREAATGGGAGSIPYPVRLGQAFTCLLEHLDPTRLPTHGGTATSVVVTMDYQTLLTGLGVATTDTGHVITAGEARRLACTGGIIPAVLGGKSEVLDLGRSRRLYEAAQRRAMAIRDQHCRAQGCDIPAAWCEAHHLTAWSRGGKTDLADGILLCPHHHHRAHDDRYLHDRLPNGDIRFQRRT
jgi:hypothetical protein